MTKHRSVVTGWDPDHVNPDDSTGRPKGVQTAPDMRIATTYDILAEGIFAKYGVPTITGSPTNTATISPFQAAIASSLGGFYVITVDANEQFTINLANVGAVKIYAQQQDYETDNSKVDSNVVIGVVYGATPIPAGSLLLFTTTITSQTSTSGLTFTPAFKYTGPASGVIRVPKQSDLANLAVTPTAGLRALVLTNGGGGTVGEYFYDGSAWQQSSVANPKLDAVLTNNFNADGSLKDQIVPTTKISNSEQAFMIRRLQTAGNSTTGWQQLPTDTTVASNGCTVAGTSQIVVPRSGRYIAGAVLRYASGGVSARGLRITAFRDGVLMEDQGAGIFLPDPPIISIETVLDLQADDVISIEMYTGAVFVPTGYNTLPAGADRAAFTTKLWVTESRV